MTMILVAIPIINDGNHNDDDDSTITNPDSDNDHDQTDNGTPNLPTNITTSKVA